MPNDKKAVAAARKAEQEAKAALEEARKAEVSAAAEWADGAKKTSAKKLAEEEKKRAKAERKAEADADLEAEVAEITRPKKGTGNKAKGGSKYGHIKLTQADIANNLSEEKEAAAKAAEKEKKAQVNDYLGKLEENSNTLDAVDAHSIEEALAALDTSSGPKVDKVKLKAAYEAFSESEMPKVKEAKPGLKLSQYKEMVWKAWQKSPDNPLRR